MKERINEILSTLKREFPTVETPLKHSSAFELLVATILSPQTLDDTTNKVTPHIFKKYPTPQSLAVADLQTLEQEIKLVNYYKTKAKNLIKTAKILVKDFDGKVPNNLSDLIKLAGVGRKVGNVVLSEWFARNENVKPEGFVVDTHVKRVSFRLGLTKNIDPYKVEQDLIKIFPEEEWVELSLRFIFLGRKYCTGRNPKCESCPLKNICPKKGV